jgi:hypothetical protein
MLTGLQEDEPTLELDLVRALNQRCQPITRIVVALQEMIADPIGYGWAGDARGRVRLAPFRRSLKERVSRKRWQARERLLMTTFSSLRRLTGFPELSQDASGRFKIAWTVPVNAIGDSLADLQRLLSQNQFEKLQRCPCGTWFFQKTSRQRRCNTVCYQKNRRRTDSYRLKNKIYMRAYREGQLKGRLG